MTTRTEPGTPLTENELAIATLVAAGRTNAEIAKDRVVSIRTVHAHLRNIYAKTATENRVELSNWLRPPTARTAPMPQPGTGPARRAPLSPARQEYERANVHVGLTTRAPEDSDSGQWEAEWWNGPHRPVLPYPTEDELTAGLRQLFGPPEGDPEPPGPPASQRAADPCGTHQAEDGAAIPAGPCARCGWHRNAHP